MEIDGAFFFLEKERMEGSCEKEKYAGKEGRHGRKEGRGL
jgi:hypothetical protein